MEFNDMLTPKQHFITGVLFLVLLPVFCFGNILASLFYFSILIAPEFTAKIDFADYLATFGEFFLFFVQVLSILLIVFLHFQQWKKPSTQCHINFSDIAFLILSESFWGLILSTNAAIDFHMSMNSIGNPLHWEALLISLIYYTPFIPLLLFLVYPHIHKLNPNIKLSKQIVLLFFPFAGFQLFSFFDWWRIRFFDDIPVFILMLLVGFLVLQRAFHLLKTNEISEMTSLSQSELQFPHPPPDHLEEK